MTLTASRFVNKTSIDGLKTVRPVGGLATAWEVFRAFLVLGLTSFGGPIAHLGYFHREFVEKRQWLEDNAYAELVSLCQFLPGPASSQVGIAIGLSRAGLAGALAAWIGFTLPSAAALVVFATSLTAINDKIGTHWLHGLKVVAVAVVAQALWGMGKSLSPDKARATIAVAAAAIATAWPSSVGQVSAIVVAGLVGMLWLPPAPGALATPHTARTSRITGSICLTLYFVLLFGLPVLAANTQLYVVNLVDTFYRAGALVFGGGHVVLPLLQTAVVPPGWVTNDNFLAGYGLAQAVPGPLFTFAAFLGAVSTGSPAGWLGAGIAVIAIFLPGFLLVIGALPFWDRLRRIGVVRRALTGINAAVVGLLLAAFYDPVWTSAIGNGFDFSLALAAFLALAWWRLPPWLIVLGAAVIAGGSAVA